MSGIITTDTGVEITTDTGFLITTDSVTPSPTPTPTPSATAGPATNLVGSNIQPNSLTLSWTLPTTGIAPFTCLAQYRVAGSTNWTSIGTEGNYTSATVSGLLASTNYEFSVLTENSAVTPTPTPTTGGTAPGPIPFLQPLPQGYNTDLALDFTIAPPQTGDGPFVFVIAASTNAGGSFTNPQTTGILQTHYTYTGLQGGTSYYISAYAMNPNNGLVGPATVFGPFTTNYGNVIGVTKISGNAVDPHAVNLVFMAEGFTSTQQTAFNNAVASMSAAYLASDVISTYASKFNIYRINVNSTVSTGAGLQNDPQTTYFASCQQTALGYVTYNYQTAAKISALVPNYTVGIVLININDSNTVTPRVDAVPNISPTGQSLMCVTSANYSISGATNNPVPAWYVLSHELGHALFNLADEYSSGLINYTGGEPAQPNVTINTNRATIKWANLISPSTPLPTVSNPNCSIAPGDINGQLPSGIIGLYEGAYFYNCGVYRPDDTCHMNKILTFTGTTSQTITYVPFCKVCQQVMATKLAAV